MMDEAPIGEAQSKSVSKLMATLTRMVKSAHGQRCVACKEVWIMTGYCLDEQTIRFAIEWTAAHLKTPPPTFPKCVHVECVFHESLGPLLAKRLVRLAKWGGATNVPALHEAHLHFECTENNRPKGISIHDDSTFVWDRTMRPMNTAGGALIRIGKGRASAHVLVDFDGPDPCSPFEGERPVEIHAETVVQKLPAYATWSTQQYRLLRELAEMDLGLEVRKPRHSKPPKKPTKKNTTRKGSR